MNYLFGEWSEKKLLSSDIASLCARGRDQFSAISNYPLDKIWEVLERLRVLWENRSYSRRVFLENSLPSETGFSKEMVTLGLQELSALLDPSLLQKKIQTEVPAMGIGQFDWQTGTWIQAHPLGIVCHILSGNVFLVGVGSWLEGVLTKNVNILKMSSNEKIFLPQFIESLKEVDSEGILSRSVALIEYQSQDKEIIAALKNQVDALVVWGGDEAVKAYRQDLPARTRLVVFGPKLSFAVITKKGMELLGIEQTADRLAQEISIWDQNACTAPQLCYVETQECAEDLAKALANALTRKTKEFPPGILDSDTAVEIRKWRTVHDIGEARGESKTIYPQSLDWTVIVDSRQSIEPSPLHRTLRIIPFSKEEEVLNQMAPVRGYLQTIGLLSLKEEEMHWSTKLSENGALRILALGEMGGGEIDDPHDGSYDLPQLMNQVVIRPSRDGIHPIDKLSLDARTSLISERLRMLVHMARKAPYYHGAFKEIQIRDLGDIAKLPILSREKMEQNMPPQGYGLNSLPSHGGYVTRSGGSTGTPKFSLYDKSDWTAMIEAGERVIRGAGLRTGDRLANCMMAGDLYGSFVSFDHINSKIGATSFAFAGNITADILVDIWKKFKLNAIQAIPTSLVPLLRESKKLGPDFSLTTVIFAGTPLASFDAKWIRENLRCNRLSSVIGANDGGPVAFQCEYLHGNLHHLVDDFNWVEIINDQGNQVDDGDSGRILITSLLKFAYPLIRYEIGDSGKIVPGTCECGRTGRLMEYLGRSDNAICIANMNVKYKDILDSVSDFSISCAQLSGRSEQGREFLVLRIESSDSQDSSLKEKILAALLTRNPQLKLRLDDKSLLRFDIELFPIGTLPRNPRTSKIKLVVDER